MLVFGESLGAWSSSDVVMHQGIEGFDHYGIDRALWFGLPGLAKWSKNGMRDGRNPSVPAGTVQAFDRYEQLAELDDEERGRLRAIILDHDNDPIAQVSFRLAVKQPRWLDPDLDKGRNVPETMIWTPILTFIAVAIDAMNAMRVVPGEFKSFGHGLPRGHRPLRACRLWLRRRVRDPDAAGRRGPQGSSSSSVASGSRVRPRRNAIRMRPPGPEVPSTFAIADPMTPRASSSRPPRERRRGIISRRCGAASVHGPRSSVHGLRSTPYGQPTGDNALDGWRCDPTRRSSGSPPQPTSSSTGSMHGATHRSHRPRTSWVSSKPSPAPSCERRARSSDSPSSSSPTRRPSNP